jgi:hypothetical protein
LTISLGGCGDDGGGDAPNEDRNAAAPPAGIVAQIPGRPLFGEPQAKGTYVGAAGKKLDPAVALVVQDDQVAVYVCDGRAAADWFGGPVQGDRFDLESENGTRIAGTIQPTRVTGKLTFAGGGELDFAALPAARERPRTGLFVFDDPSKEGRTARWIVTREVVRGLSVSTGGSGTGASGSPTGATGSGTNGLTITRTPSGSGDSQVDSRFAGAASAQRQLLSDVNALRSELAAARSEDVSLRDTLGGGGGKKKK